MAMYKSLSLQQTADLIAAVGDKQTILAQGEMGIGKSSILKMLKTMPQFKDHFFCYVDITTKDVGDFLGQLVELGLQGGAVIGGVGVVRRLGGQILHALQDVGGFVERTFGSLQQGDGIAGVAHGYVHAARLSVEAGGDLQAGGVVGGAVDAHAGAQALLVGAQGVVGLAQIGLGDQRGVVGMNRESHVCIPSCVNAWKRCCRNRATVFPNALRALAFSREMGVAQSLAPGKRVISPAGT